MARRFLTPNSGGLYAICIAAGLLVVSHANTVFASSPPPTPGNVQDSTLPNVPADQLHAPVLADLETGVAADEQSDDANTTFISSDYLTPEAKPALRRLLREDLEKDQAPEPDVETAVEEGEAAAIKARVPGLSDDDLERYKRQMYRRDI